MLSFANQSHFKSTDHIKINIPEWIVMDDNENLNPSIFYYFYQLLECIHYWAYKICSFIEEKLDNSS
ncbi:hypothetical protein [Sripur virus]|uniref:Uncharacterized protein n=1 Tax=Sripur virus TaxID=1620897 RepID=A0A0D3R1M1_9RHAB|nr:hypothetical protein [Sripur virus]AJR28589.1 hypothetical protein [Sripur virus]